MVVDGRELAGKATGVGRYLASLLRTWAADPAHPHRYTVVVPSALAPDALPHDSRIATVVAAGRGAGTVWEQTTLARAARELRPDVFFAPGYTAPLRLAAPLVLVVHDVSFFAHPEWFGWREGLRRRLVTQAAARRARVVLTVSEFSAQEIVKYLGVPGDRVVAVPHGMPDAAERDDRGAERAPIVLFVGSLFNRRRLPEMIESFSIAAAKLPDARLILVGDNRTRPRVDPLTLASRFRVADRVDWRQYVSDEELEQLYRSARVFLFLSDYEGFAMTPMEAIARGAAPVLLDTAVAREIYAGAARFVTTSPADIAGALQTLLADTQTRRALVDEGRARLARFTWTSAAAAVTRALERAAT